MVVVQNQWPIGTTVLKPNETYQIPSRGFDISGRNLLGPDTGVRPIIKCDCPSLATALHNSFGSKSTIKNVDFLIPRGTNVVTLQGQLELTNSTVRGGGGKLKTVGASGRTVLTNWWTEGMIRDYDVWVGGLTMQNDYVEPNPEHGVAGSGGTKFTMRNTSYISLNHCGNRAPANDPTAHVGSTDQSIRRVHATNNYVESNCSWDNRAGSKAVGRFHDGGFMKLTDVVQLGDFDGGCLDEALGGINMLPGPRRQYYDVLSLQKLDMTRVITESGFIKLSPGILSGDWVDVTFSATKAGAIFAVPYPYMHRSLVTLNMKRATLKYHGSNNDGGRVFSDEDGAKNIRVEGTFNLKSYVH
jgi:hypothetical protein